MSCIKRSKKQQDERNIKPWPINWSSFDPFQKSK